MTREERLYTMTMACLVEVANKLGIKIDKKGAKSKAVAKILEAEAKVAEAKNDAYVAEVMEQKKELGIECPPIESYEVVDTEKELTDEQYAEIGKEIAEEAKEKAEKASKKVGKKPAKKSKRVENEAVAKILEFIWDYMKRDNYSVGGAASEDMKFRALRLGTKQFCKVMWTKQNVRLYFRCDIADIAPNANSLNYNLPNYTVLDKYDKATEKAIKKLLDRAALYELDRKNSKK